MTIFIATFKIFGRGPSMHVYRWASTVPSFFYTTDRGVQFGTGRLHVIVTI